MATASTSITSESATRGSRRSSERRQRRRAPKAPPGGARGTTEAPACREHRRGWNPRNQKAPVGREELRAEVAKRLPFEAEIVICQGRDIVKPLSRDVFASHPPRADVVRFVSVLSRSPRLVPSSPVSFPATGKWLLKILATDKRFVFGLYRREMKAISYLGALDRVFGVPVTTRNWNTITAIAEALDEPSS